MGAASEEVKQETTDNAAAFAMRVIDLDAYYGARRVLKAINLDIHARTITALIGPSGAGKSTLLRCLNRLHEEIPGGSVHGTVLLGAESIYDPGVDPVLVRRRIGMVFQRAVPFPTMSIADNVTAGLRLTERLPQQESQAIVERALRQAALWDEVKDRLGAPATALSGGQQQRLTIARALAVQPEVLLMDEPASALDPIATARIEDLIRELRAHYTIVIVTHNMQEAARVAARTAFLTVDEGGAGILVEEGPTTQVFGTPRDQRTRDYVAGRFG